MTNSTKTAKPSLLITGCEGSLAQWIIQHHCQSFQIVGIDNCARYGTNERDRNYDFVSGDLCDQHWTNSIFEQYQPDFVLHCAAQIYGVVGFHRYSADILGNNAASTISVLAAAARQNVRKVAYISSSMVYERAEKFPLTECMTDQLPTPHTGYGLSKLFGERLVKEYHHQYDLDYVIWRPFNIITPLESWEQEPGIAHVFTDFIKKIVVDRCDRVEIFGDGNQIRCFTWINDIAQMIMSHSWANHTSAKTYNLGSETPTRIVDLAQLIWHRSGRTDPFLADFVTSYQDDVLTRIPDCAQARGIGWHHSKTVEQLVDICVTGAAI